MAGDGTLSFVVPVRHHESVSDWQGVTARLAATLRSIARQTTANWRAVVVANRDAKLPEMPAGVEIVRVDLPCPVMPDPALDREAFYEAIRDDKGRRVLAGLMHLKPLGHVMVVDYDDFVSRRLAAHVLRTPDANGWFLDTGYLFSGSSWLYAYPSGFHQFCGTSHLVRADLLGMPLGTEAETTRFIRRRLGSHRSIEQDLQECGTPLAGLPFRGAVYRIGHGAAVSRSSGLLKHLFPVRETARRPHQALARLTRLRPITKSLNQEFFGKDSQG